MYIFLTHLFMIVIMSIIEYLPTIWLVIVALIPMSFIVIGIINIIQKENIKELAIKFIIAILLYLPFTIFCLIYIASAINSIEDKKRIIVDGKHLSPSMDYQTSGLFLVYALFGLALSWLVKTDLSKSISTISGKSYHYKPLIK